MAAGHHTKARKRVRPRKQASGPKLSSLKNSEALREALNRFGDACNIIEVACRSLENKDSWPVEAAPVRVGLRMLDTIYTEFDQAINAIGRLSAKK